MSTQSSDWSMTPAGVGHAADAASGDADPADTAAPALADAADSSLPADTDRPTVDTDGAAVGSADADEDARRAGGAR